MVLLAAHSRFEAVTERIVDQREKPKLVRPFLDVNPGRVRPAGRGDTELDRAACASAVCFGARIECKMQGSKLRPQYSGPRFLPDLQMDVSICGRSCGVQRLSSLPVAI